MTRAYITKATVKTLIGLASADTAWDTHIDKLIEAVCQAVDYRCKRTFVPATGVSTRYYHTTGGKIAVIDDMTALSGTTIGYDYTYDGTYAQSLTVNTDFILRPGEEDSPYRWLELFPGGDLDRFPIQRYGLKIAGTFQYASTVPDIVKTACEMMVTRLFKRKDTSFATVISSSTFDAVEIYRGMDPDVSLLLEPVSRRKVVIL